MAGQAMVELALVLPVLALLAIGTVNLSAMYRAWQAADTAAAEGARYAAQDPGATADEVSSYALSAVGGQGLSVTVEDDTASESTATMRVTTVEGDELTAQATVRHHTRRVTAAKDVELLGGWATWRASATHAGSSSEVVP